MAQTDVSKEAKKILKIGLFSIVALAALVTPGMKFWIRVLMILSASWIFLNITFFLGRIKSGNKILNFKELSNLVEKDSIRQKKYID